jgi:hypothetical protein
MVVMDPTTTARRTVKLRMRGPEQNQAFIDMVRL